MGQKNLLFDVKWWFLVILTINLSADVRSAELNRPRISTKLFTDDFFSTSHNYVRVISVTKYMARVLEGIIKIPRYNRSSDEIKNNLQTAFSYLLSGFKFLEKITENNNVNATLMNQLLLTSKYNQTTVEFYKIINNIETIFNNTFIRNINAYDLYDNNEVHYFLNETIFNPNFRNSIELIDYCHTQNMTDWAMGKNHNKNIFQVYVETVQSTLDVQKNCNISLIKLIIDLYERTLIDVLKGYTMMIIGQEFLHVRQSNFNLSEVQMNFFNKYWETTTRVLRSVNEINLLITLNHKSHKACDPPNWEEGVNYIRVKNYVSGRAEYVAMNFHTYKLMEVMNNGYQCNGSPLSTNINDDSFDYMRCPEIFEIDSKFCPYIVKPGPKTSENDNAESDVKCYNKTDNDYIFKLFCYCDKHSNEELSMRTLSLREHRTDSADRRVVTGIRFAVKDNIISIDIQEGKLVNGTVDRRTVRWVPGNGYPPSKGPDNIRLSFHVKSFNLDDIELPEGYFVTGVKFELLDDNHITLVVRGTKMWEECESWRSTNHRWFYPTIVPHDYREKIEIKDYRNSAEVPIQNIPMSHSGWNYIDLSVGLLSHKYNNLPVIPFFDSQGVESNPPSPLGGVGLFYKGQLGYGGFIAFRLISSQYTFNILSEMINFNNF